MRGNRSQSPLEAIRQNCLECCNGSAQEVRLCPVKSCPLWGNRLGRKPTAEMLAELGDELMYPLGDGLRSAEFHKNGGTALKAIKRYVLDFFGGSKSEVRNCKRITWCLHPFRLGKNPNRKMRPDQRAIAAARLRDNMRGKHDCG